MIERIICLAIGYVFGMIQTGYFYGKMRKIDIRDHGSGNAGTTNTLRTLGWKAGAITFLGDCFKCIAAVVVARAIFAGSSMPGLLLGMYAGMGAVLGHNYPCYLGFKGGKGIACMAGVIITQVSVKPPTFVIFVNDKELMHFSYLRYLENKIREAFGFRGTSLKFFVRERKEKEQ